MVPIVYKFRMNQSASYDFNANIKYNIRLIDTLTIAIRYKNWREQQQEQKYNALITISYILGKQFKVLLYIYIQYIPLCSEQQAKLYFNYFIN